MPPLTNGVVDVGDLVVGNVPAPRRLVIDGMSLILEQDLSVTDTTITMRGAFSVALAWTIQAGTTTLSLPVTYASALDVAGARPYARLRSNADVGLAEQTVIAPSGGGSQTITFTFGATTDLGAAVIDLIVPVSGLSGTVEWAPAVQVGQSANVTPGSGGSGGGNGIKAKAATAASAVAA